MNKEIDKIILVSLSYKFTCELGRKMSDKLGMLFCDVKDLLDYELVDREMIEFLASVEFLKKSEKKVATHISSFENVVVAINPDYLINNLNTLHEKSLIVFINLPQKYVKENGDDLEKIIASQRNADLEKIADVSVTIRKVDVDFVLGKVIDCLGRVL